MIYNDFDNFEEMVKPWGRNEVLIKCQNLLKERNRKKNVLYTLRRWRDERLCGFHCKVPRSISGDF